MRPLRQLAIIGTIVFLFILFFPQFASTRFGKRFFLESIQTKTHTTVTAKSIHLSWLGPQQFSNLAFEGKECKGQIQSLRVGVHLWSMLPLFQFRNVHRIHGDATLENGSFEFTSPLTSPAKLNSLNGTVRFHQGSADFVFNGGAEQDETLGSFTLQGQVKSLANNPEFSFQTKFSSIPTLPIARIICARFPWNEDLLIQILGNSLNLSGNSSFHGEEGLLDLSLNASNIDCDIHGNIQNDYLTLNQPLLATIRLTPELSEWVMKDFNPLFVTAIQSKSPIHVRIEPSQFRCPLRNYSLYNLEIGQGMIDMGQILCKNGGSLAALVSLFKTSAFTTTREMTVWFSPLYFSMHDGLLKTQRLDALIADSIHICSWGNINLINDELDMHLGISAETLQHSFGIKNLSDDFVLKIPLTGTTKKPNLATSAAAAKIAALIASQKSPHNWLTGGILNILIKADKDVPPPNRPFPWE